MKRLKDMLRLARPHGGEGETLFVEQFLLPYQPVPFTDPQGEVLAYVVSVGVSELTRVLFSGHVDSMHRNNAPARQLIHHDKKSGFIYKKDGVPLGADNAAGCWLMLEMIDAGVPGVYVFHRGEERGGVGSRGMAEHHCAWLGQFDYAIAFDRRGVGSVITEMACGRTCSNEFAQSLADRLNSEGLAYAPDDTGVFTDTANYRRLIPECTNLSVGYDSEHTPNESLDTGHLFALRNALISVFKGGTGDLPVVRKVNDKDDYAWSNWTGGYGTGLVDVEFVMDPRCAEEVLGMTYKDLTDWVRTADARDVADLLTDISELALEMQYAMKQ